MFYQVVNSATHLTLCEVKVWGPAEPVVIEQTTDEEVCSSTVHCLVLTYLQGVTRLVV